MNRQEPVKKRSASFLIRKMRTRTTGRGTNTHQPEWPTWKIPAIPSVSTIMQHLKLSTLARGRSDGQTTPCESNQGVKSRGPAQIPGRTWSSRGSLPRLKTRGGLGLMVLPAGQRTPVQRIQDFLSLVGTNIQYNVNGFGFLGTQH